MELNSLCFCFKKEKRNKNKKSKKYKNVKQIFLSQKNRNVDADSIKKHVLNNIKEFYKKNTHEVTSRNSFILND